MSQHELELIHAKDLSIIIVVFCCLILIGVSYLLLKKIEPDKILRLFGTLVVIFASLFLIVAGYTEEQIAPVIGLLGTVLGYILGKSDSKSNKEE